MLIVRTLDLPRTVEGLVSTNEDGSYSVYINNRLSKERQLVVLAHETAHIGKGHFHDGSSLSHAEQQAQEQGYLLPDPDVCQDGYLFPRQPLARPTSKQLDKLMDIISDLP